MRRTVSSQVCFAVLALLQIGSEWRLRCLASEHGWSLVPTGRGFREAKLTLAAREEQLRYPAMM